VIDGTTWPALLAHPVTTPDWSSMAAPASVRPGMAGRNGPASAFLPARRDEIGQIGAG
jgi:hypothetical protein